MVCMTRIREIIKDKTIFNYYICPIILLMERKNLSNSIKLQQSLSDILLTIKAHTIWRIRFFLAVIKRRKTDKAGFTPIVTGCFTE